MSNETFSFYYDPTRQGYDLNTWSTLSGAPVVVNNYLSLKSAGILHFADLLRGDASFSINISAPVAGDDIKFGFIEYNKGEYLYFKVAGAVLTAESSNGVVTNSTVIPWVSSWTTTDTVFRIKWEAGSVKFYIGGQLKATIDTNVPNEPLCLYALSTSALPLSIKYIEVTGVQSLMYSIL